VFVDDVDQLTVSIATSKCNGGKNCENENNMKMCAYNTGYYERLCVRMTMRIM